MIRFEVPTNRSLRVVAWLFVLVQILLLVYFCLNGAELDGFFAFRNAKERVRLFVLELIVFFFLSVFIHEIAHLLIGALVGYDKFIIQLRFEAQLVTVKANTKTALSKPCRCLFYSAGVLANTDLILFSLILGLGSYFSDSCFPFAIFIVNLGLIIFNLLPLPYCGFDGREIVKLLRNSEP